MSDLFRCGCEHGDTCTRISACRANAVAEEALDEQRQKFAEQIEELRGDLNMAAVSQAALEMRRRRLNAEIAELRADLTTAEAELESLQNKWASRPLSVEDTAALERENDALRAELAEMRRIIGDTPDSWAALVRDAGRYRWLRANRLISLLGGHKALQLPYVPTSRSIDEAIDAVMKEQQP